MTVRKKPRVMERLNVKKRLPVMERLTAKESLIYGGTESQRESDSLTYWCVYDFKC